MLLNSLPSLPSGPGWSQAHRGAAGGDGSDSRATDSPAVGDHDREVAGHRPRASIHAHSETPAHQQPWGGQGGLVQGSRDSQDWFCPLKQVAGPKGKAPPIPAPTREAGNR